MTDDELRQYLKPKGPHWGAIIGVSLSLLTAAAGLAKWAFTAPTREDYEVLRTETTTVKQDHAVLKANVEGMRSDLGDVKIGIKEFNQQLQQLRITGHR